METFDALLALCERTDYSLVDFPQKWLVMRCFDMIFDIILNELLKT